ncbi:MULTISPECIES: NADP-dependent oxidoreductase [unclassified Pseudomonas]|jgi:2-desacetyl-2-hydroxyethyl bacteriochlorophyllide A dehydrogenase|uniref:NADP-dependent oxidoreductase n=1 Tax=unclassified Pseudomonas TaxID=196821 RepID=UPI000913688C|nr:MULTISPECIES: NADP-dependent oxidoreductase [unclassified Pseudomonas]SFX72266.1 2-desacetyl-2-hydroxyethyl bacteriochlorophyllide A dehydrogenase [Pseudomonas sp. NFACC49-2]SFX75963.1 2-desacetyl-2-hydroxyethyl bacteriochlorophyllide A dehydrogenase [Pseudomonas sp. NFACC47-1]SFY26877.1 2-desacetyl-2-hydroxyethyl bacteriochlorophyllide A dehydrogenase [Pseudomonas sp. NFACC43]
MKSALIHEFGSPDVLVAGEATLRTPQPEEVVVSVEAASVNPLDVKIIAGYMQPIFPVTFPYAPGTDFSGVIESVGERVRHLKAGDRVVGRTTPSHGGAFAQRLVIAAAELCVIPASMGFEQAAALPTAYGTAAQALFDVGKLQPGQRVLIHAGAGGVGSMAIQLAHLAGCHVIATASAKNIELVKSLGADEVIDYRSQTLEGVRDIDLVLDTLGGETLEESWQVLRPGGHISTLVEFNIQGRDGCTGEFVFFASAVPFLPEAVRQFSAGRLQIIIDSSFTLSDTRAALEKVATAHARGKVLIRPGT